MVLLAVSQNKLEVNAEIAEAVVAWLIWQHRVRLATAPTIARTATARFEQDIVRLLAGGASTDRELRRRLDRHIKREGLFPFKAAMSNLQEHGIVAAAPTGRTRVYRLVGEGEAV